MKTLLTLALSATIVAAQEPPMPPRGPDGPIGRSGAQALLARSAELELTDAQVVKLAAIARKAEARRRTMRASMDSGRVRFTQPGDSLARRQFGERMQANMTKERDLARTDLRDAITVLTPDQQARAWETVGPGGRRPGRGMGMGSGGRPDRMPGMRRPQMRDEFGPGPMRGRMGPDDMPRGPRGEMRPGMRPRRPPIDETLPVSQ